MSPEKATILVVDDEPGITDLLSIDLKEQGYSCTTAATGEDALQRLSMDNIDAVLLGLRLPGLSGMDVLKEIKSNRPETVVIVITAVEDTQTALEAIMLGAVDYITKPFELERVNNSLEAALKAKTVWFSRAIPEEEDAEAGDEETDWVPYLDDIACGVEARLNSLIAHAITNTIVERTNAIARSLGIPEEQIEKWADASREHIKRVNILDSLLEIVEQGPVA